MVRIKHRYLLVDILYPDGLSTPSSTTAITKSTTSQRIPAHNNHQILEFHSPTSDLLTPSLLAKLLRDEVSALFGDWGVGRLGGAMTEGVSVKYLSPATSTAIIRCPRASYRLVWAAFMYMSSVPGSAAGTSRPCVFRVVRVSGTMRKAEEEAIRRARRAILRMKQDEDEGVWNVLFGADGGRSHTPGPRGGGEKDDHISDTEFGMDVDSEDESVDEG